MQFERAAGTGTATGNLQARIESAGGLRSVECICARVLALRRQLDGPQPQKGGSTPTLRLSGNGRVAGKRTFRHCKQSRELPDRQQMPVSDPSLLPAPKNLRCVLVLCRRILNCSRGNTFNAGKRRGNRRGHRLRRPLPVPSPPAADAVSVDVPTPTPPGCPGLLCNRNKSWTGQTARTTVAGAAEKEAAAGHALSAAETRGEKAAAERAGEALKAWRGGERQNAPGRRRPEILAHPAHKRTAAAGKTPLRNNVNKTAAERGSSRSTKEGKADDGPLPQDSRTRRRRLRAAPSPLACSSPLRRRTGYWRTPPPPSAFRDFEHLRGRRHRASVPSAAFASSEAAQAEADANARRVEDAADARELAAIQAAEEACAAELAAGQAAIADNAAATASLANEASSLSAAQDRLTMVQASNRQRREQRDKDKARRQRARVADRQSYSSYSSWYGRCVVCCPRSCCRH
ncbi:unnamed protein product [Ectocarpus sp. CCAP 1310/34]|nr:unnamed protein product [Ectocarpus sp. CCAP 1310/34]